MEGVLDCDAHSRRFILRSRYFIDNRVFEVEKEIVNVRGMEEEEI